jgi:hypothetical protein
METINPDIAIVVLWLSARPTGLIILILMVVWALFNGQFKNMEKGRFLALDKDKSKQKNG